MNYKTTKKHFEIFKKECAKWIEYFGLKDWDVGYIHKKDDDNFGTCGYNMVSCHATISLTTNWGDEEPTVSAIKRVAFHEVAELLLARLVSVAHTRSATDYDIEEATHGIIRRMENSVLKKGL